MPKSPTPPGLQPNDCQGDAVGDAHHGWNQLSTGGASHWTVQYRTTINIYIYIYMIYDVNNYVYGLITIYVFHLYVCVAGLVMY